MQTTDTADHCRMQISVAHSALSNNASLQEN